MAMQESTSNNQKYWHLRLLDAKTFETVWRTPSVRGEVDCVAFADDCSTILTISSRDEITPPHVIEAAVWNDTNRHIVGVYNDPDTNGDDASLLKWVGAVLVSNNVNRLTGHYDPASIFADLTADRRCMLFGRYAHQQLADIVSGDTVWSTELAAFDSRDTVWSTEEGLCWEGGVLRAVSPNKEAYVLAGLHSELSLRETSNGNEKRRLTGHVKVPAGRMISAGTSVFMQYSDGTIALWDTSSCRVQFFRVTIPEELRASQQLGFLKQAIHSYAVTEDQRYMIALELCAVTNFVFNAKVHKWEISTGREIWSSVTISNVYPEWDDYNYASVPTLSSDGKHTVLRMFPVLGSSELLEDLVIWNNITHNRLVHLPFS